MHIINIECSVVKFEIEWISLFIANIYMICDDSLAGLQG